MDNLKEYRNKHKRCRYCKYNGYIGYGDYKVLNWCHAKDKKKKEWLCFIFHNLQGFLCNVYRPKEE